MIPQKLREVADVYAKFLALTGVPIADLCANYTSCIFREHQAGLQPSCVALGIIEKIIIDDPMLQQSIHQRTTMRCLGVLKKCLLANNRVSRDILVEHALQDKHHYTFLESGSTHKIHIEAPPIHATS